MKPKHSYVLIRYKGEENLRARVIPGEEKVEFKTGDVSFAESKIAAHLCGAYKFEAINPLEMDAKDLAEAQKKIQAHEDQRKAEKEAKIKKNEKLEKKQAEEAPMREELNALKNKFNKDELTKEQYEREKEEIVKKYNNK